MLEFRIAMESIQALPQLLVAALGLSALVCLRYAPLLVGRRPPFGHALELLCNLLFAGLTSLQIFFWHLYFYRQTHDAVELGYVVLALATGGLLWRLTTARSGGLSPRFARWLPVALASLAIVQVAGFAAVTQCFADFQPNTPAPLIALPGQLIASDRARAQTDRGTVLKLYERTASPEEFESFIDSTRANMTALTERAIRRDEPALSSNCHGWVFADGRYIVHSRDVATILEENGYWEVAAPQLNDLVVYRDAAGQIIHTGIVRGFLAGDAALVEGKWGADGTYLHLAEEQPYSQDISYWHSDRGSHTLAITP